MARIAAALLLACAWGTASPCVRAASVETELTLVADLDDDDANGVADALESAPSSAALAGVMWLGASAGRGALQRIEGDCLRVFSSGRRWTVGDAGTHLALQGVRAGRARLVFEHQEIGVDVLEVRAFDGRGKLVDFARSHASLSRVLPSALQADPPEMQVDPDALTWIIAGAGSTLPDRVRIDSREPGGELLDSLRELPTQSGPCPDAFAPGLVCRKTALIRATADAIDRSHPSASGRSLRAEVGGTLALSIAEHERVSIRVGGPRVTRLGPLERYRGVLRVRIVRLTPGGSVPIGGNVRGAIGIAANEVQTASALWGQCGIHFGLRRELDVKVVDPPPSHLLAIGCEYGLPASGGTVAFRVDTHDIRVPTRAGETPVQVADHVLDALHAVGVHAESSPNAQIAAGASRSVDVLAKRADGSPLRLEPLQGAPLSSDSTLNVCLGEVDLSDGLTHFNDFDAVSGTLEERTLIKAFDDGDPSTIEVFFIPSFAKSGRIGESFIYSDGASIQNAVIIDRAGVRAGARSYALAHELGHILLDMPDHPDDFGVDSPESLMDADAADPTIFGPRRLSVPECERAMLQSGPWALSPLLRSWPLFGAASR